MTCPRGSTRWGAPQLVAVALLSLGAAACPGGVDPPDAGVDDGPCPNDLPSECPSPAPSFQADVEPIFASTCDQCHAPGAAVANKPLVDYDDVFRRRSAVLNQVYACTMPPPDAGVVLPPDARSMLLTWLVCGSPDN